jgi:hypothetical protein
MCVCICINAFIYLYICFCAMYIRVKVKDNMYTCVYQEIWGFINEVYLTPVKVYIINSLHLSMD